MAIDKEKSVEGRIQMGAAIRRIRELEGLSLEDVAEPLGISQQTVSKIELGKWNAGAEHLTSIAKVMGYEWVLVKTKGK